jgi:nitrite reductase/ring-hydroxylating ferredoxin subunit
MSWQHHPDRPKNGTYLCDLKNIPDSNGLEVVFGEGKENFKVLLLREGDQHWAYLNSCPHFALPLNFHPQKFIMSKGMLVCAHHTAYFDVSTGHCVDGPCAEKNLAKLPSFYLDGRIYFGVPTVEQ